LTSLKATPVPTGFEVKRGGFEEDSALKWSRGYAKIGDWRPVKD